jgi:hypothetical protein
MGKIDYRIKNILIGIVIFAILFAFWFLAAIMTASAQTVTKQGNMFIERVDSVKGKPKASVQKTNYLYVDKSGKAYDIWLSSNGNAFIVRTSKNGHKYRKYLPEVTKQLRNK